MSGNRKFGYREVFRVVRFRGLVVISKTCFLVYCFLVGRFYGYNMVV